MERVIAKNVVDYISQNALLSRAQHGFVKKRSICINLLECLNNWTLILQDGDAQRSSYASWVCEW